MPEIVGVRFHGIGKAYDFELKDGLKVKAAIPVIVPTDKGTELGYTANSGRYVAEEDLVRELKPVIRLATEEDLEIFRQHEVMEQEAYKVGREQIARHGLKMTLVDVTLTFDESHLIFYFTADKRVDFRDLVRDLAAVFHRRIELRQIYVREQARMSGGVGICGRELCCSSWMEDFVPVSVKMAKTQKISMNPNNISGQCGRLLCCLNYEQAQYEAAKRISPRIGSEVGSPRGRAIVRRIDLLPEEAELQVIGDESDDLYRYRFDELDYNHPPRLQSLPCQSCPKERGERGRKVDKQDKQDNQEPSQSREAANKDSYDAQNTAVRDQADNKITDTAPAAAEPAPAAAQAAPKRRHRPRRVGRPAEPGFIPRPLTAEEIAALQQQTQHIENAPADDAAEADSEQE